MDLSCCWIKDHVGPGDCPRLGEGDRELRGDRARRLVEVCLECPKFGHDLTALAGESPAAVGELLGLLGTALREEHRRNDLLGDQIAARNREIKFLHEVSLVLQTSVDMDEVIAMALTAVTSGKGFGLNRAFLLLIDKERQLLRGHFAVGPRQLEDAERIWRELTTRDYTLRETARSFFEQNMPAEKERFQDLLEILTVPLERTDHLFIRTLNSQVSRHVDNLFAEPDIDRHQAESLGVNEMILVPLISKSRRIGLLLADNIVNRRPITEDDRFSLETFSLPVSYAFERAALYERLRQELTQRTEANRRLQEQQELIVRMEKMALVGKITAHIAHAIRNPLAIIGGFARTLVRETPPDDGRRRHVESMVREARKLEEVLQEVLNYSESLHPAFDSWDLNQLAEGVVAGMREDLVQAKIDCRTDLEEGLPLVRIDYKKIAFCLRSLIHNALEAMPDGGSLVIRTRRAGEELHLAVEDSGRGMTPDEVRSATTPFFSTKESGSGLGLSLCVRILEKHGGELAIASREGVGTLCTMTFKPGQENDHDPTAGGG